MGRLDLDYISSIEIRHVVLLLGYLHIGDLSYSFNDEEWFAVRSLKNDKDVVDHSKRIGVL